MSKINYLAISARYITVMLVFSCLFLSCSKNEEESSQEYFCSIVSFTVQSVNRTVHVTTATNPDSTYWASVSVANIPFTIDHRNLLIYNRDSMPTEVEPKGVTAITYAGDGLYYRRTEAWPDEPWRAYSNLDTIPFTEDMDFRVIAKNGDERIYRMRFNIHKQNGDKWKWNKTAELPIILTEKKLVVHNERLLVYGLDTYGEPALVTCNAGRYDGWKKEELCGSDFLSNDIDFSTLAANATELYVSDKTGNIYASEDGINWEKTSQNGIIIAATDTRLYAIKEGKMQSLEIGASIWTEEPYDGSMDGIASLSSKNALVIEQEGGMKRILLAGIAEGKKNVSCWSKAWFDGSMTTDNEKDSRWSLYTTSWTNTQVIPSAECVQMVQYNGNLIAFATDKNIGYHSKDKGLTWRSDAEIYIPLKPSANFSACNSEENMIWITDGTAVWYGRQFKFGFMPAPIYSDLNN